MPPLLPNNLDNMNYCSTTPRSNTKILASNVSQNQYMHKAKFDQEYSYTDIDTNFPF